MSRAYPSGTLREQSLGSSYLDKLPGRDIFKERLKQLYNYEKFTIPVKKGGKYFYFRNSGLQNQRVLYVRDSVDGQGRVLIDPNTWAKDGATALAEWSVSDDGKRLAYAVQDGGSDWRTIRVLDVNTGKVLGDEVKWARLTTIEWAKDGSGFFYARFPEPQQGAASQAGVENHALYFHTIGTPQTQDRLVYATPDQPTMLHFLSITEDGRYVAIDSSPGTPGNTLTVVDLQSADWKPRKLVANLDDRWSVIDNVGTKFFLMTNKDAPRFKAVTMDKPSAMAIGTDLGITQTDSQVVSGNEIAQMDDPTLAQTINRVSVYARAAPEHKLRIVKALQQQGELVAMTGDGVNDAPALKQADIGVAMGITGTDVSKEASDMVLLDDNFSSIVAAVEEGRIVYTNIRRFIKYILGSNIGEILTIAAAPLIGLGGVPLSPLQILWMNLVTDGIPAVALALEPGEPDVMQRSPFQPSESIFARGLGTYIIRIGLVFGVVTIGLMKWAFDRTHAVDYPGDPDTWKTIVFTTLCIAQMGHALAVRSVNKLVIEINPFSNPLLLWAILGTILLQLAVVYLAPLRSFFGTHPLSLFELGVCFGCSLLIFIWIEGEKLFVRWFRSKSR